MNKFLMVVGVLLSILLCTACGVSPEQAADGLEWYSAHPEEWCGTEFEQAQSIARETTDKQIPDDYGITGSYGCNNSGAWPGGYCWVPKILNQQWKSYPSTDASWNLDQQTAFNQLANRMNAMPSWSVTQVTTTTTWKTSIGLTHPDGYLGASYQNIYTPISTPQGTIRYYEACNAVVFKTGVENNQFYQAASSSQKAKYRRNLFDHENMHCEGLAHPNGINNTLMSQVYTYPGPYFDSDLDPTANEIDDLSDWPFTDWPGL